MSQLSSRQKAIQNNIHESNVLVFDVCGIVAEYVYPKPFQMKLNRHMILSDISGLDQKVAGIVGNAHVQIFEGEDMIVDLKTGEANSFPFQDEDGGEIINMLGVIDGNLWFLKSDCHTTIFRHSAKKTLTERLTPFENVKWFQGTSFIEFETIKLIGCRDGFALFLIKSGFAKPSSIVKVSIGTGLELNRFELPNTSSKFPMTITNDGMLVYWDVIDHNKKIAKLKKIDLLSLNRPAIQSEEEYECESLSDSDDEENAAKSEAEESEAEESKEESEGENEAEESEAEESEGENEGEIEAGNEGVNGVNEGEVEGVNGVNEGEVEAENEETVEGEEDEDEDSCKDYWPGSYLCIFSGDQEDEIWAIPRTCVIRQICVFSSSTLKFLRFEKAPKSAAEIFAINNSLYVQICVRQEEFDSPWAKSKAWIRKAIKDNDDDLVGMWVYE